MTGKENIIIVGFHKRNEVADYLLVILWETKERMMHHISPPNYIRVLTSLFHFSLELYHHIITFFNEVFIFIFTVVLLGCGLFHIHIFPITLEKFTANSFAKEMAGVNMH